MIQTEEARNNRNTITNEYRALVDASSLDLLSTTLDTVPLQAPWIGILGCHLFSSFGNNRTYWRAAYEELFWLICSSRPSFACNTTFLLSIA